MAQTCLLPSPSPAKYNSTMSVVSQSQLSLKSLHLIFHFKVVAQIKTVDKIKLRKPGKDTARNFFLKKYQKRLYITWEQAEGIGSTGSILLSLPGDQDPGRRRTDELNEWLHEWCYTQDFGFYDLEHNSDKPGRLTQDETQLSKSILGSKLAGLITRTLKQIWWGKGTYCQEIEKSQGTLLLQESFRFLPEVFVRAPPRIQQG